MLEVINKKRTIAEWICIALLMCSLVIGIWHAFPLVDLVNDEMYFVGGVLRAMEHHTILPSGASVPYGTLTYLLNYLFMIPVVVVLFVAFGFDILRLKLFLVQSPEYVYWTPRAVSALLGILIIFFLYKFLEEEIAEVKSRIFLMLLVFSNILVSLILHTGKVWVLSVFLALLSFYYLYHAILKKDDVDKKVPQKNIFFSTLFSFLSLSNFPFNAFTLINIPLFLVIWWKDRETQRKLLKYVLMSFVIFIVISLMNFSGIKSQILSIFTGYRPIISEAQSVSNINIFESIILNTKKIFLVFPLFWLTLAYLVLKEKIRNKKLFALSVFYFFIYFLLISVVATWVVGTRDYLRYLMPLAFFFFFIIASFDVKMSWVLYIIGATSFIYWAFTLYYLSVPTTYNNAYKWIYENLNNTNNAIINNVDEFTLTRNKASSELVQEKYCAIKCKNTIKYNLNNDFYPLVIDDQSKKDIKLDHDFNVYLVEGVRFVGENKTLVAQFKNNIDDSLYYLVDYNTGNYFDLKYFSIKNFGRNIYIYKQNK